ncbi:hypothetical protein F0415_12165 [Arenimonas fontis]|uniref:Uncharacterized protein n=2 Tax=Arenimonas fontis TaxID=2608255 RepID=A0A5B2Z650_9GAMM|nr:hypothetical protein F0415_12165 [Arenimonas fontis]
MIWVSVNFDFFMQTSWLGKDARKFYLLGVYRPGKLTSAYGLSLSLAGLASALREANAIINPGHYVEVVVERLEDGSFKASVRTIFDRAKNVFSKEAPKAILYSIIAAYIYEATLGQDEPPTVIVNDDSVIIESGNDRIIVPRNVYEAKKQVERSPQFKSAVGQVFNGASTDASVSGLKLVGASAPNLPIVPRSRFALLMDRVPQDELNVVFEVAYLEISRAIMARGRRKWEFYWHGMKIAAPVLDHYFYDRFFQHDIRIAPGDVLKAVLKIYRKVDPDTRIVMNTRYEVVEVIEHIPRYSQMSF